MKSLDTNWSRNELRAYILLYCANANFVKTEEEIEQVKSKIDKKLYKSIFKEFANDNDYRSLQKIEGTIKRLNYNKDQKDTLIEEIQNLFQSDGNYDQMEKTLFFGLKKLFT